MDSLSKRILIVEDDAAFLTLLGRSMMEIGFSVCMTQSGVEALILIEQQKFVCALLDYNIPDLNGIEIAKALKKDKKNADSGIIFITGAEETEEVLNKFYEAGAFDVIFKTPDNNPFVLKMKVQRYYEDQCLRQRLKEEEITNHRIQVLKRISSVVSAEINNRLSVLTFFNKLIKTNFLKVILTLQEAENIHDARRIIGEMNILRGIEEIQSACDKMISANGKFSSFLDYSSDLQKIDICSALLSACSHHNDYVLDIRAMFLADSREYCIFSNHNFLYNSIVDLLREVYGKLANMKELLDGHDYMAVVPKISADEKMVEIFIVAMTNRIPVEERFTGYEELGRNCTGTGPILIQEIIIGMQGVIEHKSNGLGYKLIFPLVK